MNQWRFYKLYNLYWYIFFNPFVFSILLIFKFHCQCFFNTKRGFAKNFLKLIFFNNVLKFVKKGPFAFSKFFFKYEFTGYKYFAYYDNGKEGILMIEHLALLGHIFIELKNIFLDLIKQQIIF